MKCEKGKYNLKAPEFSENCESCPVSANCDGGTSLSLFPGYWRTSNNSDEIVDCQQFSEYCLYFIFYFSSNKIFSIIGEEKIQLAWRDIQVLFVVTVRRNSRNSEKNVQSVLLNL